MPDFKPVADLVSVISGNSLLGQVGYRDEKYPLYAINIGQGRPVFISGNIHGDEPSGLQGILRFMDRHLEDYKDRFSFTFLPCLNPYGYVNNTRENAYQLDLNRQCPDDPTVQDIRLLLPILKRYDIAIDLHEAWPDEAGKVPEDLDDSPTTYFAWESCADRSARIGPKLIKAIEDKGLEVCKWPEIYSEPNTGGIIYYPEGCVSAEYSPGTCLESFLFRNCSPHTFTIEVPSGWPYAKRMEAAITSIRTALDHID